MKVEIRILEHLVKVLLVKKKFDLFTIFSMHIKRFIRTVLKFKATILRNHKNTHY